MSEFDPKTQRFLLITLTVLLASIPLLLTVVVVMLARMHRIAQQAGARRTVTATGTYCGHCGQSIPGTDPTSVIALTDRNYFVYRCSACKNETLLPSQPVHG